jgi:hypothetical protein
MTWLVATRFRAISFGTRKQPATSNSESNSDAISASERFSVSRRSVAAQPAAARVTRICPSSARRSTHTFWKPRAFAIPLHTDCRIESLESVCVNPEETCISSSSAARCRSRMIAACAATSACAA